MITWSEIETRAYAFQKRWRGCGGDERQYGQTFEKDLMEIFGVDWHDGFHEHPITTSDSVINYIDYYLPGKILIEMKSRGKSLDVAFFQAMQYFHSLKPEDQPVLVLVSDFDTIKVYNTTKQHHYKSFRVSTLKLHVRIFGLLAGYGVDSDVRTEIELNTDASYKMAKLHGALKENGYSGHELEVYLVRLLFCLFADDTGIFEKSSFFNYLQRSNPDGSDLSGRVTLLFSILDTPDEKRMKNLPEELKRFRYINGNLFSEQLTPPYFSAKMRTTLLECCDFDWTQISPAIFGAMFQGVMNPQERRELGAHYTSAENILKVIRPLFLDNLYDEFEHSKNTTAELQAFHKKIASLTFLDPACGCGNFLIITYQRLRELEFEVLKLLQGKNQMTLFDDITKVSVGQFYGIEIEEFPCEIAKVSMLLMKHLMDQEISHYFGGNFIQFPIRNNANIVKGNALRMDWNEVVPAQKLNYILGNPPFIGYSNQTIEQKEDIRKTYLKPDGKTYESAGKIDYVAGWYFKASHYISGTQIRGAFVSTNSICQGEQVADVWKPLFDRFNICINFAYRTFKWSNEARGKAAVHCVIVGFSQIDDQTKSIYDSTGRLFPVKRINPYLIEGPNIFVNSRSNPLANVSLMVYGSKPADGGFLFLTEEEKQEIIAEYPEASLLIRPFLGSKEYIQSIPRYCLWLENISPDKYSKIPPVVKRIAGVRQFRLQSLKLKTHDDATTPMLFQEIRQPDTEYILVPRVTSENRSYIPMGFITPNVICGDQNLMIPNATLCEFGVITSSTHMAWMRTVAGRLEMRYRYSAQIVYNNFPWPAATPEQKEKTTQAILNARNLYPEASLADLYNELTMPPDLRKAHLANDKAVWEAYGKAWPLDDEPACVAHLMILYQRMV
jgi:hypothetical protein